jgi:hypothetical protein
MKKSKDINLLKNTLMYKVGAIKQKLFNDRKIPVLELSGTWLSEAGFEPNDKAQVTIYPRTLIIRQVINDQE